MKKDISTNNILPVITLYQPWATWIMRGWKTIETRTHSRFSCLKGQRILIHAGLKTDPNAIHVPYLTLEQLASKPEMGLVTGCILGSAFVKDFRLLNGSDSEAALCDCTGRLWGLFLEDIERWKYPIPEKGSQGIWHYDTDNLIKVKKPDFMSKQVKYELPLKLTSEGIPANAICMVCGTSKEDPNTAYCINGHDDWVENGDEIERIQKCALKFNATVLYLKYAMANSIDFVGKKSDCKKPKKD